MNEKSLVDPAGVAVRARRAAACAAAQPRFDGLVVFGTSLSDLGIASRCAAAPTSRRITTSIRSTSSQTPYAVGGHHFSRRHWVPCVLRRRAESGLANQRQEGRELRGRRRGPDRPEASSTRRADRRVPSVDRGGRLPMWARFYVVEMGGQRPRRSRCGAADIIATAEGGDVGGALTSTAATSPRYTAPVRASSGVERAQPRP